MGAPIAAFTRISDSEIEIHSDIYEPDVVVVLDSTLVGYEDFISGLKSGGALLINFRVDTSLTMLSKLIGKDLSSFNVYVVPATELALKTLGRGITNTAMLGALLSTTQVVRIESVEEVIRGRFRGPIAEKNIEVLREAYRCVRHVRE